MSKIEKSREYAYLKKAKLEFNDKWSINGTDVTLIIDKAVSFFNTNRVISGNDVFTYFNVKNCYEQLLACETYSNIDIIRSWLDLFLEYVSVAVYLDAYRGTYDTEKVKARVAEAALAAFQKAFA